MKPEDAEEYTQALGQVVAGGWRQIALGQRLGVPKALKLTTQQWVKERLGGYVKLGLDERKAAAIELKAEGLKQREIGAVLGVNQSTVHDDLTGDGNPSRGEPSTKGNGTSGDGNPSAEPLDVMTGLAATDDLRQHAKRMSRRQATDAARAHRQSAPDLPDGELDCDCDIACRDIRTDYAAVAGVDAIITDPPYGREALPLYEALAQLAVRTLAPDGVCAVMTGHLICPEVVARMRAYVPYRWMLAYLTPGGQSAQQFPAKVNTFWKPILLFGAPRDWLGDVVRSATNDNDKRFHAWGQSESGMQDLVQRLTQPGDLVCDPFLGGGTTAVVCCATGRRFLGGDLDSENVKLARARCFQTMMSILSDPSVPAGVTRG